MTKLKERFDTLSDAIIAIIMTILVLEITVQHNTTELIGLFEEIGLFVISLIFLVMIYRILRIANRCKNTMYYLFCSGVGIILGLSFLINAFGISGLIPIKGIAVPFLSYGGSSMLSTSIMIGLVLSIGKKAKIS